MGGRSTDYKSLNSLHCTTAAADFETGPRGVFGWEGITLQEEVVPQFRML